MSEGARQFQTVPDSEARMFTQEEIEKSKSAMENITETAPELPQAPEAVAVPVES